MKKLGFGIFFVLPMILGAAGFLLSGEVLLQSCFQAFQLYLVEFGDPPANILIEIARWMAPLATAGGVLMAISVLRRKIKNYLLYCKGNCTVVYGPANRKYPLLKELGKNGVDGKEGFERGQRYILLGEERENLSFYGRYKEELANSTVYLKCSSLPAQEAVGGNLRLFCPEETAAKLFWKQNCLYTASKAQNHKADIVLIGFGKLGEELLTAGLQCNIFHPDQCLTYHVFGGDEGYAAIHPGLKEISDPVVFHKEPWYDALPLLEQAAAVIVLQQEDQLSLLRKLLLATVSTVLHVFAANTNGPDIMAQQNRLKLFRWQQEAHRLENILGDELFDRAKRINLRYAANYSGVEETEENKQKQWEALDSFTRYSNVSAADYFEMQCRILEAEGQSCVYEEIEARWQERLAHMEHMRWCRYHYLNNWKQGSPADGKKKDAALRIHTDLVSYEQLTVTEQQKDRENVQLMFSV